MSSTSGGFDSVFGEDGEYHRDARRRPPTTAGILVGGGAMFVAAIVFAGMGAPGEFVALVILGAVFFVVASLVAKGHEERLVAEERTLKEEERDRFKEEVARSVKESIKGTIKVRCRYCGGLNEEQDEKCESCSAPL